MTTERYTGPADGNWFSPLNWSDDLVPLPGDEVQLFGTKEAEAMSGIVAGVTIDVSAAGSVSVGTATVVLQAGTLGTADAPVAILSTDDGGVANSSGIIFATLVGSIDVEDSSTLLVDGGTIDGTVTVGAGSTLEVETATPPIGQLVSVTFDGAVLVDGGTLMLDVETASGSGTITIQNGGDVLNTIGGLGGEDLAVHVAFGTGGGTLDLSDSTYPTWIDEVEGFGAGDTILVGDGNGASGELEGYSYADGVLTLDYRGSDFEPTIVYSIPIAGAYTTANFNVEREIGGVFDVPIIEITWQPCFVAGTRIATPAGERAVEDLQAGDLVLLADGGTLAVTWIGRRTQRDGAVVRIRAGALGGTTPVRDLRVSEDHALFVDGVLVPAHLLVDDATILRERVASVVFHHVELERHAILLAEGAPAESYLDTGNRAQFGNCPLAYDPVRPGGEPCAELVVAGPRLERARASLRAFAPV